MADAYTTSNRLLKMEKGTRKDTYATDWATTLDMIDASMDGVTSFALSGSKTLTTANNSSDEARKRFLWITSGTGGTVTVPDVPKLYIVQNDATGTVTFDPAGAGTTCTVGAKSRAFVYHDGTNCYTIGGLMNGWTTISTTSLSGTTVDLTASNPSFKQYRAIITSMAHGSGVGQTFTATLHNGSSGQQIVSMTLNTATSYSGAIEVDVTLSEAGLARYSIGTTASTAVTNTVYAAGVVNFDRIRLTCGSAFTAGTAVLQGK